MSDKEKEKDSNRLKELKASLDEAREAGDLGAEGELLNSTGLVLKDAGRFDEAEAAFRKSLKVVDCFLDALHRARAQVYSNLGLLMRDRGELDEAVHFYSKARHEHEVINDAAGAAGMLVETGIVHKDASRLSEAQACLQQGLAGLSEQEQPTRYAAALVGLGLVHERRHEYDQARTCYERALPVYRHTDDAVNEAVVLFNLGMLCDLLNEHSDALEFFTQSLQISEQQQDRMGIVHARSAIGSILMAGGEPDAARPMLDEACREASEMGYRRAELDAAHDLALLDRDEGHVDEAAKRLLHCQRLAEEFGDPIEVNKAAFDRGDVLLSAGRYDEAAESYERAAEAVESLRTLLMSEDESLNVLDDGALEVYDRIVRLKATLLNSPGEAFAWCERSRSREFLRQIRWKDLSLPPGVDSELADQEERLLTAARQAQSRWQSASDADRLTEMRELEAAEKGLADLWQQIAGTAPEYAAIRRADVVTWPELLTCLRS